MLAAPTVIATIVVLMRKLLYTWSVRLVQRHRIMVVRRNKAKKRKKAAARRKKAAARRAEQSV